MASRRVTPNDGVTLTGEETLRRYGDSDVEDGFDTDAFSGPPRRPFPGAARPSPVKQSQQALSLNTLVTDVESDFELEDDVDLRSRFGRRMAQLGRQVWQEMALETMRVRKKASEPTLRMESDESDGFEDGFDVGGGEWEQRVGSSMAARPRQVRRSASSWEVGRRTGLGAPARSGLAETHTLTKSFSAMDLKSSKSRRTRPRPVLAQYADPPVRPLHKPKTPRLVRFTEAPAPHPTMRFNAASRTWEGNEEDLKRFSTAPRLIKPESRIPESTPGMVFDSERMRWVSQADEEDPFAEVEDLVPAAAFARAVSTSTASSSHDGFEVADEYSVTPGMLRGWEKEHERWSRKVGEWVHGGDDRMRLYELFEIVRGV